MRRQLRQRQRISSCRCVVAVGAFPWSVAVTLRCDAVAFAIVSFVMMFRCFVRFVPSWRHVVSSSVSLFVVALFVRQCSHRFGLDMRRFWSDIAGSLSMPSEFAHYFAPSQPSAKRRSVSPDFVLSEACAMFGDSSPRLPLPSNGSRRTCLFCRGFHAEHISCTCQRCGYRHQGDCVSVCCNCHRCHSPSRRCRPSPAVYLTAKRKAVAVFSNDDDSGERPPAIRHNLGDMVIECPHCQARSWPRERVNCCHNGDIVVAWDQDVPLALSHVILSSHVRQNMRPYNTVMAFASTGHDNKSLIGGTFVLGGRTYHRIGSVLPGAFPVAMHVNLSCCHPITGAGQPHSFAQIWTLDTADATERRQLLMPTLRSHVLSSMHDLFMQHNHLARSFRSAAESAPDFAHLDMASVGFTWSATDELSRFEMAAIIESPGFRRHIAVRLRGGGVTQINDCHQLYHALAYPLLFPTGSAGWHYGMQHNNRSISLHEYMRYLLMHRTHPSHVQRCERLALEFYCDAWAQIEARNLAFHKQAKQQAKYQAASARAIIDQLSTDHARQIGVPIILPASFPNSPRYYHNL